jgi:demethylmenaquinone methyltransferase/2-methoxy-6-polyprenyl-1,4-benzoquinol methylase
MPSAPSNTAADQAASARRFYDRISKAYDLIADSDERAAREQGLAALAVRPGEKVLEIGYGTGHSLVSLAQAVGPGGRVWGIDVSDGMRQVAAERVKAAGLGDRVELVAAPTPPLPYADGQFDAVSMSFTLELFPLAEIPAVLAEIKRVLAPAGRLGAASMAVARAGERESALEHVYKWMHHHFPHIVDCQPIDARAALSAAGFHLTHDAELKIWSMPVAVVVGVKP